MAIEAIGAIAGVGGAAPIAPISAPSGSSPVAEAGSSFMDVLGGALDNLSTQMTTADNLAMKLAAGEPVDIHQVMVALESASLGLQTGLQVRNKMIEAYKEIMAMPL
jgi:flagellar hook-basal body complex protein FliE